MSCVIYILLPVFHTNLFGAAVTPCFSFPGMDQFASGSLPGCTPPILLLSMWALFYLALILRYSHVYRAYAEQSRKSPARACILVKALYDVIATHVNRTHV